MHGIYIMRKVMTPAQMQAGKRPRAFFLFLFCFLLTGLQYTIMIKVQ